MFSDVSSVHATVSGTPEAGPPGVAVAAVAHATVHLLEDIEVRGSKRKSA